MYCLIRNGQNDNTQACCETYYVYSLFMTSFSMASMALSNSAAVCERHGSICFILSAMNSNITIQQGHFDVCASGNTHAKEIVNQLDLLVDRERALSEAN
jgi:hypothetical protein